MTPTEPIQQHQPRSMFSTWIGMVLLFAFFAMLAFVALKAAPRGDTYEKKRAKARAEKLDAAQKEYFTALTTYGWVDKTKGIARIPVTDAMKLTVAELADKKPVAAGPIALEPAAAPSPAASPAANTSASPAAGASPTPAANVSTTPKPTSVTGHDSEAHNQPAAAANPPVAPPGSQPGASSTPAASAPPAPAKPPVSPSPSPSASAPGTPLPVRGKTP